MTLGKSKARVIPVLPHWSFDMRNFESKQKLLGAKIWSIAGPILCSINIDQENWIVALFHQKLWPLFENQFFWNITFKAVKINFLHRKDSFGTSYRGNFVLNFNKNECEFIPRSRVCDPLPRHCPTMNKNRPGIGKVSAKYWSRLG